jgi:hypothetical protein
MIYCFDLDETLCNWHITPEFPNGRAQDCTPKKDRIEQVNNLYDEGNTIIIETARGSRTGIDQFLMTKNQLEEWGVKYHQLRTGVKFYADVYVDDRGINDKDFFS